MTERGGEAPARREYRTGLINGLHLGPKGACWERMTTWLRLLGFVGCAWLVAPALMAGASGVTAGARPELLAFAQAGPVASAVSVRVPAEFLALQITLTSDAASVGERLDLLDEAERTLRAAAKNGGLELRVRSAPEVDVGYGKLGSFAPVVSALGMSGDAGVQHLLVARLSDPQESLFRVSARLHAAVNAVKLPKRVSIRVGDQRLALADAETKRDAVREAIGVHLTQDRALLLGGAEARLKLAGTEGPLRISQVGERELALWLPFTVTYGE